jgi:hypothetical protein
MRVLLASLLALSACAPRPAAVADDEAVLRALLVDVARGEANLAAHVADHHSLCVAPRLTAARALNDAETVTAGRDGEWLFDPEGPALPAAQRRQLSAVAGRAMASRAKARLARIEPGWIPAPLQALVRSGCPSTITLSAPAIQDELAFVVVVNICGDDCAGSDLHAFRRERGAWRPVATLPLWVT